MADGRRRIRVVIADDNRSFRKGVRIRLEQVKGISVVAEASNGADAVHAAVTQRADVVLMDLEMPGMDGIAATRAITASARGSVGVVVLTSHSADAHVLRAIDAGASGYLLKTHDTHQLLEAISAADRGDVMMSPRVTGPLLKEFARRQPPAHVVRGDIETTLSAAEARVIALLSSGITTNDDIAAELSLSVNTVRSHIQSALKKTGTNDRTQLALWGLHHRIERSASSE